MQRIESYIFIKTISFSYATSLLSVKLLCIYTNVYSLYEDPVVRHPQHGADGHGPGGPTEGYEEMHRQQGDHDALWTRHYWGEWSKDETLLG